MGANFPFTTRDFTRQVKKTLRTLTSFMGLRISAKFQQSDPISGEDERKHSIQRVDHPHGGRSLGPFGAPYFNSKGIR
jgi:hypothetical protein